VYIVLSYPTESTTLTLTDIGSQKIFRKWNRTPKGSSIFSNVIVYLFVDMYVPIVHRVMSSSTKSTTLAFTDIGFQKNLSKWNRTPKGSSIFGNARAYLFVGTIVTVVYRVSSCPTKSMAFALTDIGSQKPFKTELNAERLVKILIGRKPISSLTNPYMCQS
jgi:hypothetical protein